MNKWIQIHKNKFFKNINLKLHFLKKMIKRLKYYLKNMRGILGHMGSAEVAENVLRKKTKRFRVSGQASSGT